MSNSKEISYYLNLKVNVEIEKKRFLQQITYFKKY